MGRGVFSADNGSGTSSRRPQQHTRTRSQQQLTSLDIEYTRSPLKSARDALRRANARTSPPPSSSLKYDTNGDAAEVEGDEENTPTNSPRLGAGAIGKDLDDDHRLDRKSGSASPDPTTTTGMTATEETSERQKMKKRSRSPSSESANRNRFDFSGITTTGEGSDGSRRALLEVNEYSSSGQKDSDVKRPKLDSSSGRQATLHNFFTKSGTSKNVASSRTSPSQRATDASNANTPKPSTSKASALKAHATPTIDELRAMPTLNLRTMTPSPRKPSLQIHRSALSPNKLRSVSDGSALTSLRSSVNSSALSESIEEEMELSSHGPDLTSEPQEMPLESEEPTMQSDENAQPPPSSPREVVLPSVNVEDAHLDPPQSSLASSASSTLRQSFKDSLLPPSTPRRQILPSRPIGFFSPLTPLPGDETYDYEEEERAVQEHERKLEEAARRKKELEDASKQKAAEVTSKTSTAVTESEGEGSKAGPSRSTRPANTRTKKGGKKTASSSSAAARGTSAITKRAPALRRELGVLASAPSSPRMRTTRAQLLRQKAMQPRKSMSTPTVPSTLRKDSISNVEDMSNSESDAKPDTSATKNPTSQRSKVTNDSDNEGKKGAMPKKKFVLTVPSSLSPVKPSPPTTTQSSPAISKSFGTKKFDSKPFTFSLYPPDVSDPTHAAHSKKTLSNLSSALEKLSMPPPEKPASSSRPAPSSEQKERVRPATSLGFNRELSLPPPDRLNSEQRPRPQSRSGILPPSKTMPAFPRFNSADSIGSSGGVPRSNGFRFGFGGAARGTGTGIFGRPIPRFRASKKTSLETVEGSPVKGAAAQDMAEESSDMDTDQIEDSDTATPRLSSAEQASETEAGNTSVTSVSSSEGPLSANGKELKRISKLNASRRASMAFSALAQSLTTPSPTNPSLRDADKRKMLSDTDSMPPPSFEKRALSGSFSGSSSSRPIRAAAQRAMTTGYGMVRAESEDPIGSSERQMGATPMNKAESDSELGTSKGSKRGMAGRSKMPGSLDVLAHCTILVDVRTEDGEDAGGLFVDMLRGLGAKVRSGVGPTCTHIVYKNGLTSTVTKYRLLDEPRPHVVGIGWVVECVEKRTCVDVDRFKINLEEVNVAGTLKRRRSILHKPMSSMAVSGPMDAFLGGSSSSKPTESMGIPKACMGSDSDDGEEIPRPGSSMSSSFNPLERARRRTSMATQ